MSSGTSHEEQLRLARELQQSFQSSGTFFGDGNSSSRRKIAPARSGRGSGRAAPVAASRAGFHAEPAFTPRPPTSRALETSRVVTRSMTATATASNIHDTQHSSRQPDTQTGSVCFYQDEPPQPKVGVRSQYSNLSTNFDDFNLSITTGKTSNNNTSSQTTSSPAPFVFGSPSAQAGTNTAPADPLPQLPEILSAEAMCLKIRNLLDDDQHKYFVNDPNLPASIANAVAMPVTTSGFGAGASLSTPPTVAYTASTFSSAITTGFGAQATQSTPPTATHTTTYSSPSFTFGFGAASTLPKPSTDSASLASCPPQTPAPASIPQAYRNSEPTTPHDEVSSLMDLDAEPLVNYPSIAPEVLSPNSECSCGKRPPPKLEGLATSRWADPSIEIKSAGRFSQVTGQNVDPTYVRRPCPVHGFMNAPPTLAASATDEAAPAQHVPEVWFY
ncbi:hypothetical protein B0T17DRAFT_231901 [Bombardia bombarda]|uniref:Uncharacterized protein n=1 Tax=Bombardia bombarda TaxID=252184 RepID=A0AA40CAT8_9PEZI|nr:hypothetical protein B0T17DRAFT_231901 [Bombardia bombarda]